MAILLRSSRASRAARSEARDRAIAAARRQLDQAREALAQLEDQARAEGVPIP